MMMMISDLILMMVVMMSIMVMVVIVMTMLMVMKIELMMAAGNPELHGCYTNALSIEEHLCLCC